MWALPAVAMGQGHHHVSRSVWHCAAQQGLNDKESSVVTITTITTILGVMFGIHGPNRQNETVTADKLLKIKQNSIISSVPQYTQCRNALVCYFPICVEHATSSIRKSWY
jgi:hypothetical protein